MANQACLSDAWRGVQGEACTGGKPGDRAERGVLGFGSKVLGAPAGLSSLTAALGLLTGDAFRPPLQALPLDNRDRDRDRDEPTACRRLAPDGCPTARSAWPSAEGGGGREAPGRCGYGDAAHEERRTGTGADAGLRSTDGAGAGGGPFVPDWRAADRNTPRGTCGAEIRGAGAWGAENAAPNGAGAGGGNTTPNKATATRPERNRDRDCCAATAAPRPDGRISDDGAAATATAHVVRQMAALDLVPRLPLQPATLLPPPATARQHVPATQPAAPSPPKSYAAQPTALGLRFPPHPLSAGPALSSRPAAAAAGLASASGAGDGEDGPALVAMHRSIARALAAAPAPAPAPAHAEAGAGAAGLACAGVWVCKWVDYSKKYGLGYTLSNGCCGVFFNDATKMLLAPGPASTTPPPRPTALPPALPFPHHSPTRPLAPAAHAGIRHPCEKHPGIRHPCRAVRTVPCHSPYAAPPPVAARSACWGAGLRVASGSRAAQQPSRLLEACGT